MRFVGHFTDGTYTNIEATTMQEDKEIGFLRVWNNANLVGLFDIGSIEKAQITEKAN